MSDTHSMSDAGPRSPLDHLIALQAIHDLKGRRDHAVDQKDWDTYAALHSDDYVAMSIGAEPLVGGRAAADALAALMAGVTTVHHCHTPVIAFQDRDNATGVWAMEDNLFWHRGGEKQWLRGFGFYHETYVRGADGQWRFSYRRLERTHAETSPGAARFAVDRSGENPAFGA
ncbi:MAG: nuclear transport factor 2 family protein [Novosphingobium sp.]